MAIYEINKQGIESLSSVKTTLSTEFDNVMETAEKLNSIAQSNCDILGPHIDQIESIIKTVKSNVLQANDSAGRLNVAIQNLISRYEGIIARKINVDLNFDGTISNTKGSSGSNSLGSLNGSCGANSSSGNKKRLVRKKTPSSSGRTKVDVSSESSFSSGVNSRISSFEELNIYKGAGVSESTVDGRVCLIKKIDIDYVDPVSEKTNLVLMKEGRSPIDPATGDKIEIHHVGQDFDSPFVELTATEHRKGVNDIILHDKTKESWRNDRKKENEYNNVQRVNHWKERARNYLEALKR